MSFYDQFTFLEPKNGVVPYYPLSRLPDIVWRARHLLKDRNSDEIVFAAETIDWMIEQYFESERESFIQDQIENNGWAKEQLLEAMNNDRNMEAFVEYELLPEKNEAFDLVCCTPSAPCGPTSLIL